MGAELNVSRFQSLPASLAFMCPCSMLTTRERETPLERKRQMIQDEAGPKLDGTGLVKGSFHINNDTPVVRRCRSVAPGCLYL